MNELQLIRNQLLSERARVTEVAAAVASAQAYGGEIGGNEFRQAAVEYLVLVLTRFEERDQLLLERAPAPQPLASLPGSSREALTKLEAALASGTPQPWGDFLAHIDGAWRARRDAFDAVLERNSRVTDWRAISFVDADSILDERARYARVQSARAKTTT